MAHTKETGKKKTGRAGAVKKGPNKKKSPKKKMPASNLVKPGGRFVFPQAKNSQGGRKK